MLYERPLSIFGKSHPKKTPVAAIAQAFFTSRCFLVKIYKNDVSFDKCKKISEGRIKLLKKFVLECRFIIG
jgi:hypothetical protein